MVSFEKVVDEYDAARPAYPDSLFDHLGGLVGVRVIEGGAGTGIATRALLDRGASVVPFDVSAVLLARAVTHSPGLRAVVADGAMLPFTDNCADLICFAQSWHWLQPGLRCVEASRVLVPGGRWAGWWSHARADGEEWFDRYWTALESSCPGLHRSQRDTNWGSELDESRLFVSVERVIEPWTREVSINDWLTDQASHSYVAALGPTASTRLLDSLRHILDEGFPSGQLRVPYETWLWTARGT